jgi:hypothetical protein
MMKITFTPRLFTTPAFQTGLPDFSIENSIVTNSGDGFPLFNRTKGTNFFTANFSERF